jgi:hypothetical protein
MRPAVASAEGVTAVRDVVASSVTATSEVVLEYGSDSGADRGIAVLFAGVESRATEVRPEVTRE